MQKSGIISNLELQKRFKFVVNGVAICSYVADFCYLDASGRECVEDVKGFKTREYVIKSKLMIACFGIRVTEV